MKRKNFSAQPNNFMHDENKEHQLTQLLKNPTEKLIVIIIDGLQKKYGKNFQKSAKQLAAMCLCARSTFINNIEKLIERGIITKHVVKTDAKENETTYWTLNFEFDFEIESDNPLSENETRVIPNSDNGYTESGQKEDALRDIKDSKKDIASSNSDIDYLINDIFKDKLTDQQKASVHRVYEMFSNELNINVYKRVLIDFKNKMHIVTSSFEGLLKKFVKDELNPQQKEATKQPVRVEKLPERYKENAPVKEVVIDNFEEEKRKLQEELRQLDQELKAKNKKEA